MKVLVTGAAGFIGFHLTKYLVERGDEVIGLDNINDYYDVNLKYDRLKEVGILNHKMIYNLPISSSKHPNYKFIKLDLTDEENLKNIFATSEFDVVCNLAAQAGVRYSLTNPKAYIDSNVLGFLNVLEGCRKFKVNNLVYASSSSVYGLNEEMPFSVHHNTNHPVSIYAASKKSNELMAHAYSHLFNIPTTGLRFFTVYGPWGRPDMALYQFTKGILENKEIEVYNNGNMKRDFTYIDDIIDGIIKVIDNPAKGDPNWNGFNPDPSNSQAPFRVFNIGRGQSVDLLEFILEIEKNTGMLARKKLMPLQSGDVIDTWADINDMKNILGYSPKISVPEGVKNFVCWYLDYYGNVVTPQEVNSEVN
ncbi:NAD-dependent epimerase [Pedobacter sp.]|uniref:NAD-dependent epimerase n=1 Tax=Pedobacter sp. TaxID=1411316 RepID=UPI003D7F7FA5